MCGGEEVLGIRYLIAKIVKKIQLSAISNSSFERPSKAEAQCTICNSNFGRYTYCGYNCVILNCDIGRFCSISDNVRIGMAQHPTDWLSTSPAFYSGSDSIPKDIAVLDNPYVPRRTTIGNDVWIGSDVLIKGGIKIGDGAVIGMGSVVTHDVAPYAVVGGNPAKEIRKRFSDDVIEQLQVSEWWNWDIERIKRNAKHANSPVAFLRGDH